MTLASHSPTQFALGCGGQKRAAVHAAPRCSIVYRGQHALIERNIDAHDTARSGRDRNADERQRARCADILAPAQLFKAGRGRNGQMRRLQLDPVAQRGDGIVCCCVGRFACRDAAGQIRKPQAPEAVGFLLDDRVIGCHGALQFRRLKSVVAAGGLEPSRCLVDAARRAKRQIAPAFGHRDALVILAVNRVRTAIPHHCPTIPFEPAADLLNVGNRLRHLRAPLMCMFIHKHAGNVKRVYTRIYTFFARMCIFLPRAGEP